ncbi:MAG: protease modulator HflC [Lachnospiraceae bacterium]|nr:protease modulator HflC [Candidatus Colinaster equi]
MGKTKKYIIIAVVVIAAMIFAGETLFTVNPNEAAIVINLGKIVGIETTPGLHIHVPFVESIAKIYTGDVLYDIPVSDVITSDKKSMIADNYVIWKVTDPTKYYQSLGGITARAEERIEAAVYNATKNTISAMSQDQIIAARGNTLTKLITDESNSDIAQYGIVVELAEIKALDLPDDNKEAVYERMISERNNIAAGYTANGQADAQKIKNEANKQISILTANAQKEAAKLEAEGEARYMQILSEAYNTEEKAEFYSYIRGLDSLEAMAGENKTLILDKNSEYARLLYGQN